MIEAVIFDVGGVLHVSTSQEIKKGICRTMGVAEEQYVTACKTIIPAYNTGEITDENEFWKRFIALTKSGAAVPDYSLWGWEFLKKYQIQTEVMEIVGQLKLRGLKVAILSNTIDPHAKINREKGVYDPFEIVILSSEIGIRKPDKRAYELTLKKLGVKPENAVFIDDSSENVQAAVDLGIHGVTFQNAEKLKKDLSSLGVKFTN